MSKLQCEHDNFFNGELLHKKNKLYDHLTEQRTCPDCGKDVAFYWKFDCCEVLN